MFNDPIIEELHEIREQIAAESNYDLHEIVLSLRRSQRDAGKHVVTLPPKLVTAATETNSYAKVETLSATNSAS